MEEGVLWRAGLMEGPCAVTRGKDISINKCGLYLGSWSDRPARYHQRIGASLRLPYYKGAVLYYTCLCGMPRPLPTLRRYSPSHNTIDSTNTNT
jgi:hypothetical protein